MNRFYLTLSKVVCTTAIALCSLTSNAQNTTTLLPGGDCGAVTEDFNDNESGYVSPSIFVPGSQALDYVKNGSNGFWTTGNNRPGSPREYSIISPTYINPSQNGTITVGFQYVIDGNGGTAYQIRILSSTGTVLASTSDYANGYSNLPNNANQVCLRLADTDLRQGDPVRIEVTLRVAGGADIEQFDNISLGGEAAIVLPVKFMGIAARNENNTVRVLWDVAEETDVLRYEVERSTDGRNFTKVGEIGTNAKYVYSFTDNNPVNGVAFYRVKNVDIDGKSAYSTIVRMNLSRVVTLRAYPTPANSRVTIEHSLLTTKGNISLTTADGRVVKRVNTAAGTTQTAIDLSGLNAGIYLARFDKGNGEVETVKVIKQ